MTNPDVRDYVLLGAGGHARVLQETLTELGARVSGYLALTQDSLLDSVPWLGDDSHLSELDPAAVRLVNGVGSVSAPTQRRTIYLAAIEAGFVFASVLDVSANIRRSAKIGAGAQVLAGAFVNSEAAIGDNVLINSGAIVEHHAIVGSHVHLSPGVVLGGGARIGEGSHIGLGARVLQGVSVGENCTIGAGAVVISDISDGQTAVGVPAAVRPRILS